jgi:hypothetical protein
MKVLKSIMLVMVGIMLLSVSAKAAETYSEHQGLQVLIKMDKEQYEPNEAITAIITVVNTNAQSVTIANLEQLIPEGYVLAENSQAATKDVTVHPGQSMEMQVTFIGEPAQPAEPGEYTNIWDKIFYGETFGIPNIILVVIAIIAIIVFMALT